MNKESIKEAESTLPESIQSAFPMTEPNSSIPIYTGEFIVKSEAIEIKVIGSISFDWLPNKGIRFSGRSNAGTNFMLLGLDILKSVSVLIDGLELGSGYIKRATHVNNELLITGFTQGYSVSGDKSVVVNKIRFSIPNLRKFHGLPVRNPEKGGLMSLARINLETDGFSITIDKCLDFDERFKSLDERGGYIILYAGELVCKKGSIKFEDCKDVLYCFSTFLSLLNGRRTSAFFAQGLYGSESIWTDYTNYHADIYKDVFSWPLPRLTNGINEIWQEFCEIWKDKEDRNFLTSLIHWYVEANGHSAFAEGSIVIAQIALELIYNWWIIENKKIIIGKDAESISAANKIRLILSQLNISNKIPPSLKHLQAYIDNGDDAIDGVDAIVQIRNAVIHSHETKRKKLTSIDSMVRDESLQLYLWYIEMSILCILGFKGKYLNRCCFNDESAEQEVPWISEKAYP